MPSLSVKSKSARFNSDIGDMQLYIYIYIYMRQVLFQILQHLNYSNYHIVEFRVGIQSQ